MVLIMIYTLTALMNYFHTMVTDNDMYLNGADETMILIQVLPTTYKAYQATDKVLLQNDDPTLPK